MLSDVDSYYYDLAEIIPQRSLTCSKAPGRFMPLSQGPLFCQGGDGAIIYAADGKPHIDMLCALGAISLGYERLSRHWRLPDARLWGRIRSAWSLIRRGGFDVVADDAHGVYSLPHISEGKVGRFVLDKVAPRWGKAIRFVKSGSEATHAAYRIAKAHTGRSVFLRGDWAYHGWYDWCHTNPENLFPHNVDLNDWVSPLVRDNIAAVFIEPHRWERVDLMWLHHVREFCREIGALFIFDSMIVGGRFALEGSTRWFGLTPDLECYGKAYANGEAAAFVIGSEAMKKHGHIVSGTFSGDVTGLSAIQRTVQTYIDKPVISTIRARGDRLWDGLEDVAALRDDVHLEGNPVHLRLRFNDETKGTQFSGQMAKRGVLWHPGCANVSFAHTNRQIDQVLQAARESVAAL